MGSSARRSTASPLRGVNTFFACLPSAPTSTLPSVLRTFAEWTPTSALANALRHLFANPGGVASSGAVWPLAHPIAYTLIWAGGIVLVCAPLRRSAPTSGRSPAKEAAKNKCEG